MIKMLSLFHCYVSLHFKTQEKIIFDQYLSAALLKPLQCCGGTSPSIHNETTTDVQKAALHLVNLIYLFFLIKQ